MFQTTTTKQQEEPEKKSCKNKKSYCDQAVEGASVARLVQPPCMHLNAVIAYSEHLCDYGEDKRRAATSSSAAAVRANELDVRWPPTSLPAHQKTNSRSKGARGHSEWGGKQLEPPHYV